jgi:hypothetical protein
MTSKRGLQGVVILFGVTALIFGLVAVITGGEGVRHGGPASANVDSEFRFFAAWYAGAGALLLSTVPRVEKEGRLIRAACGVLLLGAVGRVLSIAAVGRPDGFFLFLLALEVAIPLVLVPWQSAVAWREKA